MSEVNKSHLLLNYFRGVAKVFEENWQSAASSIGLTQAEQHTVWIVYLEKKISISRLAELGLWDRSTVMQVIKRLKTKELVKVEKAPHDLWVSYVSLTPKGLEKWQQSLQKDFSSIDYIQNKFNESPMQLQQVLTFLEEFNRHFHGDEFVNWTVKTADCETRK